MSKDKRDSILLHLAIYTDFRLCVSANPEAVKYIENKTCKEKKKRRRAKKVSTTKSSSPFHPRHS